jgi:HAE1 family hydrophobic/amphiphilic exporter-1
MVLVDVIGKHLKSDGTSVRVLIEAAVSRLPAVLLTSLSTIGGVLPIMCMGNRDSVWPIMAMGVAAGLFSSTLLTLVVTPVLYAVFSPVYEP